jgi:hypothetical protein
VARRRLDPLLAGVRGSQDQPVVDQHRLDRHSSHPQPRPVRISGRTALSRIVRFPGQTVPRNRACRAGCWGCRPDQHAKVVFSASFEGCTGVLRAGLALAHRTPGFSGTAARRSEPRNLVRGEARKIARPTGRSLGESRGRLGWGGGEVLVARPHGSAEPFAGKISRSETTWFRGTCHKRWENLPGFKEAQKRPPIVGRPRTSVPDRRCPLRPRLRGSTATPLC